MRKGSFATLLVITLVAGAAAVFALRQRDGGAAAEGPAGPLFPALSEQINDVAALTVTAADSRLTIRREDGAWIIEERGGFPARFETVKQTLLGVADLEPLEQKTSRPELHAKLGLQEPEAEGSESVLLTLAGPEGSALAAVLVGHRGSTPGTVYVRKAGENQCWLARGDLAPDAQPTAWMDRDVLRLPADRVRSASIAHADGETLQVSKEKTEDADWQIQDIPEGSEPRSPAVARSVATALEALTFDDVAAAASQELPADGRVTAVFETFDGLRVTVVSASLDDKTWASVRAESTEAADATVKAEAEALQARLANWVYVLPEYRASNLRKHLADLIQVKQPAPAAADEAAPEGGELQAEPLFPLPDGAATDPASEGDAAPEPPAHPDHPGHEPDEQPQSEPAGAEDEP